MTTKRCNLLSRGLAVALLGGLALSGLAARSAGAAEGSLRIAKQFGVVYLLLNVAEDQKLVEKHGRAAGLDIKVEYVQLSGGSAVNDALLSGNIEVAGAGVGPLFTLWDRTRGKQAVKGVASLGNFPYYLVTNRSDVTSIADFTDKDRIALPAVGVSVQARILQWASAKLWGDKAFAKLDPISVAVPHPEAAAAIIKGGTEITGHFGNPPYQEQELAENPNAHRPEFLRCSGRPRLLDRALRDREILQGQPEDLHGLRRCARRGREVHRRQPGKGRRHLHPGVQ